MPPSPKNKTKAGYHHGNLRSALIGRALKLIEQRKDVSFTLREIARRAGVSHAAAYRHFADKRELLGAIAEEGFRLLAGDFARTSQDVATADLAVQLQQLGMAYIQFALKHPGHFRAMFHSELADREPFPTLEQAAKEAFNPLRRLIEAGIRGGRFRGASPEMPALAAWSLVHGFALLALERHVPLPATAPPEAQDQLASAVLTLFLEGLIRRS